MYADFLLHRQRLSVKKEEVQCYGSSTPKEQILGEISPKFSRELLLHNYTLVCMEAVYTKSENLPNTRRGKNHLQNVARARANARANN